jgi:hypothetical protein
MPSSFRLTSRRIPPAASEGLQYRVHGFVRRGIELPRRTVPVWLPRKCTCDPRETCAVPDAPNHNPVRSARPPRASWLAAGLAARAPGRREPAGAACASSQHGIHDPVCLLEPLLHERIGGRIPADVERKFGSLHHGQIAGRVTLQLVRVGPEDQLHDESSQIQVPSHDQPVPGVVSGSAANHDWTSDADAAECVDAASPGVFHQDDPRDLVLVDGTLVKFSHLLASKNRIRHGICPFGQTTIASNLGLFCPMGGSSARVPDRLLHLSGRGIVEADVCQPGAAFVL